MSRRFLVAALQSSSDSKSGLKLNGHKIGRPTASELLQSSASNLEARLVFRCLMKQKRAYQADLSSEVIVQVVSGNFAE